MNKNLFSFLVIIFFLQTVLAQDKINNNPSVVDSMKRESDNPSLSSELDSIRYMADNTIKKDNEGIKDSSGFNSLVMLNTPPKWYDMFTNIPGDLASFYENEITVKNIPLFLGISAATAILIATDQETYEASDRFYNKKIFYKNWSDIFVSIGDGKSQFGISAAFALYGFAAGDNRALRTASQVFEAVLTSGGVVQVIKHITGRESPFTATKDGGTWRFFPNQIKYHKHVPHYDAFPSGHLTTSIAAFVVIADNYPEVTWIKPVAYTLSTLIGISMVNQGIHWYSDYPLAIFLGYSFGKIASSHSFISGDENKADSGLHIQPYFGYNGNGLSVIYKL
ncbi:MAG: phosphatase PAP2 family protein [Bacteroidota bacterium]|nr:phosphatase PAP2 family protein [Bacteroidota bacterium]